MYLVKFSFKNIRIRFGIALNFGVSLERINIFAKSNVSVLPAFLLGHLTIIAADLQFLCSIHLLG